MNEAIQQMLGRYECQSAGETENALREIFQELALLGLWRGKFFERAAFYGGTALRILHGLDRFSEDMDFSLLQPDSQFDLAPYCAFVEKELSAWGFPVQVQVKQKTARSAIESAFLKAGTVEQFLQINASEQVVSGLHRNQVLRIKVEVDTNPPGRFSTESRYLLQPIPFAVRTVDLPSLFAGKMHALLFRQWGQRVKGRDWYDLVWYIARKTPVDLKHLEERMRQTDHWSGTETLSKESLLQLVSARINSLDVVAAKKDIEPFLKRPDAITVWSREFFMQVVAGMQTC